MLTRSKRSQIQSLKLRRKSDSGERLKSLSAIIASVFVPLAVVIIANIYAGAMKDSETRIKYVELALAILKSPPATKTDLREWAIKLINNYSEVKLDSSVRAQLLEEPLLSDVDKFIQEKWAPEFMINLMTDENILRVFREGNKDEIRAMMMDVMDAANEVINEKRSEMRKPLIDVLDDNPSGTELDLLRKKLKELNKN